jgi:hypothetical protein
MFSPVLESWKIPLQRSLGVVEPFSFRTTSVASISNSALLSVFELLLKSATDVSVVDSPVFTDPPATPSVSTSTSSVDLFA